MKSKDLIAEAKKKNAAALAAAFRSGDEAKMSEALAVFMEDVHDAVMEQASTDIRMAQSDAAILAARGKASMTSEERTYFNGLATALRSDDPKMALTNWTVTMPQTVIDDAISTIKRTHPLLDRLKFQPTGYLTKFVLNDQPHQTAAWGTITSAITQELNGKFREVDLTALKLTAFMVVPNDLLELGPQYLKDYVTAVMFEADAYKMEVSFVDGTGKSEPIGMTRNTSSSASVQGGVYPRMDKITLADFRPQTLGAIVSKIARTPGDPTVPRAVTDLFMLVNGFDYWEKIMPATTLRLPDGSYIRDYLPIPADIIQTVALNKGELLLGIPARYFVGIGPTGRNGSIEYDDSCKFLDDARVYRVKTLCNAFPMDEYAFVLCDISNFQPIPPIDVRIDNTTADPVNTKEAAK